MLELTTLSGKNIDLNSNQVTIQLSNSLFNDGSKFNGSSSFPLKVAFTDNNKVIFDYVNALETGTKNHRIPVHAKIGGQSFRNCVLAITVAENSFDCNLEIDLGEINNNISNTSLKDVPFPLQYLGDDYDEIRTNMGLAAANLDWRTRPYSFIPVRNRNFTGDTAAKPPLEPNASGDQYQPVAAPVPYGQKVDMINGMSLVSGELKFNVQLLIQPQGLYHTVPYFYLPAVLDGIASFLGFKLKGDFCLHPDIEKVLVYNNNDVFVTRHNIAGYAADERKGILFTASDHLPDMTISELLKALCAYFCIRITINSKGEMIFSFKKSAFENSKFRDWSNKLVKVSKQEFEVSKGFKLTAETDPLDTDKEPISDTVTIGQGKEKIDIKAGVLRTITENFQGMDVSWTIPIDSRSGNIPDPIFKDLENYRSGDKKETFPLRFMIAKGLVPNSDGTFNYPTASITGSQLDLNLKSTYEKLMKPWMDRTYGSKKIKALFLLSPEDICTLGEDDIILIKGENNATVQCIYENITFTSAADKSVRAEADLIVLDSANIDNIPIDGVYIKITEINPQTTSFTRNRSDYSLNVTRSLQLSENKKVVDLKIELFSDQYGNVPLVGKEVTFYVDVKVTDNRTANYMHFRDIVSSVPEASEWVETRKIVTQNSEVIIPGVLKKTDTKWWLTTPTSYNTELVIKREQSFTIQKSDNYMAI